MGRAVCALVACGLVLEPGCRRGPEVPADFAAQEASFREAHAAEIGGPRGPLSVREAHYVEPGHRISFRVEEGRVVARIDDADATDDASAPVSIVVRGDRIECTRGCEATAVAIDAARDVELAPVVLGLSPQSGGLRVLVHDPLALAPTVGDGLHWFPPAERWWRSATIRRTPAAEPEPLATTRGLVKPMTPFGTLVVSLPGGGTAELVAYDAGPTELLVPFTDATNGEASYDVGRYLTVTRPADGEDALIVDFNRATNPWCAYSEHYNCPIPPAQNRIEAPVDAGEQRFH